ncbi:AAA family ATPase [uncultured Methanobrevibacter sp.]|uniref:AAA family ATPase n=1 Tax=uncultured Methanobrevibacter sp. TaxID=253161 RepID=UPI0026211B3D|nr:AAA family ATPase [uncultured Methanobrevibacter sp.]
MNENLTLEIKYFGKIHYAKLELNKINVIGGINSSGKSTASKLLYCFLKANSLKRLDYVKEEAIPLMNTIINIVANPQPYGNHGLSGAYSIDDDFLEILDAYKKAKKEYKKIKHLFAIDFVFDQKIKRADGLIRIVLDEYNDYSVPIFKLIWENESLSSFKGISNLYGDFFRCSIINGEDHYYKELRYNYEQYMDDEFEKFNDSEGYYSSHGNFSFLTDVFYLDSFSIFDMKFQDPRYMEHIQYLTDNLRNTDDEVVKNIESVQEKINSIISGQFNSANNEFSFVPEKGYSILKVSEGGDENTIPKSISTENTSSGIKQIGVIQLLLANHKLKPGTFLVIDEPEVNLHPEWQFKFAEILVLLAKELDVIVYLNSHSPMFIESIDAFSEYYDFGDSINFYLTHESNVKGEYSFKRVKNDELYRIYDNLGRPYDLIDQLRLKKHMGDLNGSFNQ